MANLKLKFQNYAQCIHWPQRFHQVEIVDEKDKSRRKKEAKEKDAKEATKDKEKEIKETEITEKEIKEKEIKEKDKDKEKEKEKADREETTATDLPGSQCVGGTLKGFKFLYSFKTWIAPSVAISYSILTCLIPYSSTSTAFL